MFHHVFKKSSYRSFTKDPVEHIHIDTESLYKKGWKIYVPGSNQKNLVSHYKYCIK